MSASERDIQEAVGLLVGHRVYAPDGAAFKNDLADLLARVRAEGVLEGRQQGHTGSMARTFDVMLERIAAGEPREQVIADYPWRDHPPSLATLDAIRAEGFRAGRDAAADACDDMGGWRDWAKLKDESFPGAPCEAAAAACYLAERIRALEPPAGKEAK
jgi:hypothetical protein